MADPTELMADTGCLNLRWSLALVDGLIEGGVRHFVLSPGSRSTPIVLAGQRRPELRMTPILDERSAGFFALGLARGSGRPVALLATSGSAPAHWYPAVIEAAAWGLPLVLLSADRPPTLRHWGASQTIDQTRLFGEFVCEFHDPGPPDARPDSMKAVHALGRRAALVSQHRLAPVHLNLPFHEPLAPQDDCLKSVELAATEVGWQLPLTESHGTGGRGALPELPAGRGLILCGPGTANTAEEANSIRQCARALGVPLLADALSGVRFHGQVQETAPDIRHYDALLRNPHAAASLQPDWVLRFGLAPVSKRLGEWLTGVPSWLADTRSDWCDPSHDALGRSNASAGELCRILTEQTPAAHPIPGWIDSWYQADRKVAHLADAQLRSADWCEGQLIQQLLDAIPDGEALFCANSMPIRQLDTWSYRRQTPLQVFGNRGVSGIDGQLSTLAGLNASGIPTWALLGDLSFTHDLSGLLLSAECKRPIIVINNGGGRIFDYLPQHGLADFNRYWRTPVTPDIEALANAFRFPHRAVDNAADFAAALALPPAPRLIEVKINAELSRAVHLNYWRQVTEAQLLDSTSAN